MPMRRRRLRKDPPWGKQAVGLWHRMQVDVRFYSRNVGESGIQPSKVTVMILRVEPQHVPGHGHVLVAQLQTFPERLKDRGKLGQYEAICASMSDGAT